MGNLYPTPLPLSQIKDEKIARFGFCAVSSLIQGDGDLLIHFILSKIVATALIRNEIVGIKSMTINRTFEISLICTLV